MVHFILAKYPNVNIRWFQIWTNFFIVPRTSLFVVFTPQELEMIAVLRLIFQRRYSSSTRQTMTDLSVCRLVQMSSVYPDWWNTANVASATAIFESLLALVAANTKQTTACNNEKRKKERNQWQMDQRWSPGATKQICDGGKTMQFWLVKAKVMVLYQPLANLQYITSALYWRCQCNNNKKGMSFLQEFPTGQFLSRPARTVQS